MTILHNMIHQTLGHLRVPERTWSGDIISESTCNSAFGLEPVVHWRFDRTRLESLVFLSVQSNNSVPSGVDAPVHSPLDNFTHELASELRERLGNFLSSRGVRYRDDDRGPRPVLDYDVET